MHAIIPVQVEEQTRWALGDMQDGGDFSPVQLLQCLSLIERYRLDLYL
jgi:hypothetical protein